jgi:hypothetical protein
MDAAEDMAPAAEEARGGATDVAGLSAKARDAFLDRLAETCSVAGAAEAAGIASRTAHARRRRDAGFAAAWNAALEAGYQALELKLVAHALSGGGAQTIGDEGLDVALAVKLLSRRGATVGKPAAASRAPLTATRDETNAAILKKLKSIEARYLRRPDEATTTAVAAGGKTLVPDEEAGSGTAPGAAGDA